MTAGQMSAGQVEKAAELDAESREAMRLLILTLADNKRLLGIRYSDWMLGAPTLETGIAASSMAQDEWGHGRLTYALLSDFGEDPKRIEHGREAAEYRSMEAFDKPFGSWAEMIAAALLLDTALTVQYGTLAESRYEPARNRVQKLLDEEVFHFQYAVGWAQRIAASAITREALVEAVGRFLPVALRWLGRGESGDALRARYLEKVGPVLLTLGLSAEPPALDWTGWDAERRRSGGAGPDADTLARVRGDKNRAMLLD